MLTAVTLFQVYETLADRKMHLLFELWDKDGDGQISFAELALGLRKLSPPNEPVTDTASDAAEVALLFSSTSLFITLVQLLRCRFSRQKCEGVWLTYCTCICLWSRGSGSKLTQMMLILKSALIRARGRQEWLKSGACGPKPVCLLTMLSKKQA